LVGFGEIMQKKFPLGDVLSVMFNVYISDGSPKGIYDLLEHLTGKTVDNDSFDQTQTECSQYLKKACSILHSQFKYQVKNLLNDLKYCPTQHEAKINCIHFCVKAQDELGANEIALYPMPLVPSLPKLEEKDKLIVVDTPSTPKKNIVFNTKLWNESISHYSKSNYLGYLSKAKQIEENKELVKDAVMKSLLGHVGKTSNNETLKMIADEANNALKDFLKDHEFKFV
jgi:hypothetical protein